ncbi:adenylate/guanylate cyclase domain-containing protein [Stieleria varia]|uniref:Adenylate cyclase 1 n=1 Tax=Stieleria varia TaxID=2528005 RepID=A0A5C6B262_9BACT|nr:adenylate/guanylate cyclase domain-containing protein [Stieleria varia]TWU05559.1 Adenylate cyclase 1 [Stieleria varia]
MPDLIAQGPSPQDRWRREIPSPTSRVPVVIGRSGADWEVPWDSQISRQHIRIIPQPSDRLEVVCLPTARNPVFHGGSATRRFTLVPGDHFVIGQTTFTLANRPGASEMRHVGEMTEHAFDHAALQRRHFRDASTRIDMLSRLPDLITSSGSDQELLVRVTSVLLQATPAASAVAIVCCPEAGSWGGQRSGHSTGGQPVREPGGAIEVLHYDSRVVTNQSTPVSGKLVRDAIKKRESVLNIWASGKGAPDGFTASEDVDWAFCVPLRTEACPGWALYVTGQLATQPGQNLEQSIQAAPQQMEDDVKFAELVGTTIANLRQSRRLERRQSAMRHFFAPVVMDALARGDSDEALRPREANLSVMFCDLRGFSRRSERDSGQLLKLLENVSDALGVMTRHILGMDGVIGDFHGDAAMGFWGWPLEQSDAVLRAMIAATRIREEYAAQGADGFRCGIGLASGAAVAGRIGTVDQVKVTAFGPVVNLASRLEGMTKAFGAAIIVDEVFAQSLHDQLNDDTAIAALGLSFSGENIVRPRLRRLARVRPAGFASVLEISELLSSPSQSEQVLTDQNIADYESGLDAMVVGDWESAMVHLHQLPPWDRPKDVLIATMLGHNRVPPATWDGVIELPK